MSVEITEDDCYYCAPYSTVAGKDEIVVWIGIRKDIDSAEFVEYFKNSRQTSEIEIISYHVHSTLDDDPHTRCVEIHYKLV